MPELEPASDASRAGDPRAADLVHARWACAVWSACGAAFIAGFFLAGWRPVLWVAGLGVAGALCLINAKRCGRTHCYLTGPVDLIGAVLAGLNGVGLIHILWMTLGWAVVIGVVAAHLIEGLAGRYRLRAQA